MNKITETWNTLISFVGEHPKTATVVALVVIAVVIYAALRW